MIIHAARRSPNLGRVRLPLAPRPPARPGQVLEVGEFDAVKGVRRARRDEPRGCRPFHVRGHRLRTVLAKLVRVKVGVGARVGIGLGLGPGLGSGLGVELGPGGLGFELGLGLASLTFTSTKRPSVAREARHLPRSS